jgi:hypothetical protein
MHPFKSQDSPLLLKGTTIPSNLEGMNRLREQMDELVRELGANLVKTQDHMRRYANVDRREGTR